MLSHKESVVVKKKISQFMSLSWTAPERLPPEVTRQPGHAGGITPPSILEAPEQPSRVA